MKIKLPEAQTFKFKNPGIGRVEVEIAPLDKSHPDEYSMSFEEAAKASYISEGQLKIQNLNVHSFDVRFLLLLKGEAYRIVRLVKLEWHAGEYTN